MKDQVGPGTTNSRVKIVRDRTSKKVWFSQANTPKVYLSEFNMKNVSYNKGEKDSMGKIPYSFAIGSLITQQFATKMTLLTQQEVRWSKQNTGNCKLDSPYTREISQVTAYILKDLILSSFISFFIENDFPHWNLGVVVSLFYSRYHARFYSCNIP